MLALHRDAEARQLVFGSGTHATCVSAKVASEKIQHSISAREKAELVPEENLLATMRVSIP